MTLFAGAEAGATSISSRPHLIAIAQNNLKGRLAEGIGFEPMVGFTPTAV